MLTQRGKRLETTVEEYALSSKEAIELIEQCVNEHYKITPEQLRSKCRKRNFTDARRMYLMIAMNTVDVRHYVLAKNITQDHSMAWHAKNLLNELDEYKVWNQEHLDAYEKISNEVVKRIITTIPRPNIDAENNYLKELVEIMESLKDSEEGNPSSRKLRGIMNMIFIAEKSNKHNRIVEALQSICLEDMNPVEFHVVEECLI